jgi:hypothetical protein
LSQHQCCRFIATVHIIPAGVILFWAYILSLGGNYSIVRAALIGGFGTLAAALFFLWAFVNLMTWLTMPKVYRVIKKGGGDPWFDSVPEPFNNDDPSVRYQELFEEKLRQENEQLLQPLVPQRNDPKDSTKGIDDPNFI